MTLVKLHKEPQLKFQEKFKKLKFPFNIMTRIYDYHYCKSADSKILMEKIHVYYTFWIYIGKTLKMIAINSRHYA